MLTLYQPGFMLDTIFIFNVEMFIINIFHIGYIFTHILNEKANSIYHRFFLSAF